LEAPPLRHRRGWADIAQQCLNMGALDEIRLELLQIV